jgi:hypothetical protein
VRRRSHRARRGTYDLASTDEMDDRRPDSKWRTVTPRRPRFDFEGLEYEVPRAWHAAAIGPTAFLEALSVMAPVVEAFFIDDARRLLPRVADAARGHGLYTYADRGRSGDDTSALTRWLPPSPTQ